MDTNRVIKKIIRCPECFSRDLDSEMFYDPKKKEYYCRYCCYTASEEKALNDLLEFKKRRYKSYNY